MAIGWCILLSQANSLILLFSFLDILSSTKSSSQFLILSRILPRIQHSFQRMLPSAFYSQHSQVLWFCLIQGCEKLSESLLWGEHCPLQNPGQVCTGNFGPSPVALLISDGSLWSVRDPWLRINWETSCSVHYSCSVRQHGLLCPQFLFPSGDLIGKRI